MKKEEVKATKKEEAKEGKMEAKATKKEHKKREKIEAKAAETPPAPAAK